MKPDRHLALKIGVLALAMFAFGFALVPLYDVFCAVTGFGGKTAEAPAPALEAPDLERTVRVEFTSSVARGAPFTLEPEVSHMQVHPGQLYVTHYRARNLAGSALVGQAVPSVVPGAVAEHFRKTECFCFTTQEFRPYEELTLKLAFMVAPELPANVDTLSLSYAYFSAAN